MPRRFLTRSQATYKYGLMSGHQRKEPPSIHLAIRDRLTGEIFEAEPGEHLHAEIAVRVGVGRRWQEGWTEPE